MNSVMPFGHVGRLAAPHEVERPAVDRPRRHVLAEPGGRRRPSSATASNSPRSSGSNTRPSVIENPRSTSPRRLSVISAAELGLASRGRAATGSKNSTRYPAFSTRPTDWRRLLFCLPSRLNRRTSTTASSPMYRSCIPLAPYTGSQSARRAHHRDRPAVLVGELAERAPRLRALADRTDRVGRHERDPVVHAVRDERVAETEPLLVVAQREVRQRVGAVLLDDEPRPLARQRPVRRQPRRDRGPEQQPAERQRDRRHRPRAARATRAGRCCSAARSS